MYQGGVSETRKRGTHAEINDDWREAVEKELARRKMKKMDLAEAIGASPSGISLVLKRTKQKGSIRESKWASDIAEYLEVPLPITTRDWRAAMVSRMEELQRRSQQEFEDALDDFQADLARRLTRAAARRLNSGPPNAVGAPHGGSPNATTAEDAQHHRGPPRSRR